MTTIGTPSAHRMIDFMSEISSFHYGTGRRPDRFPVPTRSSSGGQRAVEIVVDRRRELLHV
jgi:hypothetical protein